MSRQSRASDEPEPCETRFSVEKERTNERSIQLVVRVKGIQLDVGAKLRAAVSLPPCISRYCWKDSPTGIKTKESLLRTYIVREFRFIFRFPFSFLDDSLRIFGPSARRNRREIRGYRGYRGVVSVWRKYL